MTRLARLVVMTCSLGLLSSVPLIAGDLAVGVKGGVNLATLQNHGDGAEPDVKSRVGLVAGMFVTLPLTSWLELQPEALYAAKGAKLDATGVKIQAVLDYLEVPVLARLSRRAGGTWRYYAAAGPSLALRLRAKSRTDFGTSIEEIDIGNQVERLDLGVAAGGGVEFGSLVIDARYNRGFRDIDRDKTDSVRTTTRAISLTVGFRF